MDHLANPNEFVRVYPWQITDEFIKGLIRTKSIPAFDATDMRGMRAGYVEPVKELPDELFRQFIDGLINAEALFHIVDPDEHFPEGEDGKSLFEWSKGRSREVCWKAGIKKVTNAPLYYILACYCNLWRIEAREYGCTFPVVERIGLAKRKAVFDTTLRGVK